MGCNFENIKYLKVWVKKVFVKKTRENKLGLSGPSTYFRFFIFLPFNGSQAISSASIILFATTSNMRKVLYHTSLKENNAVQTYILEIAKEKHRSIWAVKGASIKPCKLSLLDFTFCKLSLLAWVNWSCPTRKSKV